MAEERHWLPLKYCLLVGLQLHLQMFSLVWPTVQNPKLFSLDVNKYFAYFLEKKWRNMPIISSQGDILKLFVLVTQQCKHHWKSIYKDINLHIWEAGTSKCLVFFLNELLKCWINCQNSYWLQFFFHFLHILHIIFCIWTQCASSLNRVCTALRGISSIPLSLWLYENNISRAGVPFTL